MIDRRAGSAPTCRDRSRPVPTECSRGGETGIRRRTTPRGCSLRRAGAVRLRRGGSGTARFGGRRSKPWIPAFAGMTVGDSPYGGERGVCDFTGAAPPRGRPAIREPPVFKRHSHRRRRVVPERPLRNVRAAARREYARRTTTGGCPYDPPRVIAGPANGARIRGPLRAGVLILRRGHIYASRAIFHWTGADGSSLRPRTSRPG